MIVKELLQVLDERPGNDVELVDLKSGERLSVDDVGSYRGFCEQIALEPCSGAALRAKAIADEIRLLMKNGMEGYKGGHYVPDDDTPVWVSRYGEMRSVAIVGHHFDEDGVTALLTVDISEY